MTVKNITQFALRLLSLSTLTIALMAPAFAQSCDGKREKRSQTRIVGGWIAKIKDWPGQAVFRMHNKNTGEADYFCGGAAIAPNWIITAAHCFADISENGPGHYVGPSGRALQVQLGTDNLKLNRHPHIRQISKIIRHENYVSGDAINNGFDLALVKIKTPWQGPFATLSLNRKSDPSNAGQRVMVAGFGLTKGTPSGGGLTKYQRSGGSTFYAGSDKLLQTALPMVGTNQCANRHQGAKIANGQLCAGLDLGGKDSCNGDSGGPLVAHTKNGCPYQVGVVSWGPENCGVKKYYGVYTRISHFADWITSHVPNAKAIGTKVTHRKAEAVLSKNDVTLAIKQIEDLLGAGRDKVSLQLRVVNDGSAATNNRVKADEHYIFDIASQVNGRLIIIDIDEDGRVVQIFPNKYTSSSSLGKIVANAKLQIPNPNYGFDAFRAEIPQDKAGQATVKGKLIAFVVPDNFQIDNLVGTKARLSRGFVPEKIPTSYLMNLINQISSLWSQRTTGSSSNRWAYSIMDYEIINQ